MNNRFKKISTLGMLTALLNVSLLNTAVIVNASDSATEENPTIELPLTNTPMNEQSESTSNLDQNSNTSNIDEDITTVVETNTEPDVMEADDNGDSSVIPNNESSDDTSNIETDVPKSDPEVPAQKNELSTDGVSLTESTVEEYVKQLLNDNSIAVSNVRFTGNPKAARSFTNGLPTLGIDSGIIIATGDFSDNNEILGEPGDPDIESQIGSTTFDAFSIEFDFVPKYSNLNFNYIFGSREYPDFVGSEYNDAFAFFVNGVNVAKIPGTNELVTINNVNSGKNTEYFIDNTDSHLGALPTISFGGITTVLPISSEVNPHKTNHIKIVIADTMDSSLSSFVAIQKGSFKSVGTVTTYYLDDKENPISEVVIINVGAGDSYKTEPKVIDGYTLKEVHGNSSGVFNDGDQIVTYIYVKSDTIKNEDSEVPTANQNNNEPLAYNNNLTPVVSNNINSTQESILPETGDNATNNLLYTIFGLATFFVSVYILRKKRIN